MKNVYFVDEKFQQLDTTGDPGAIGTTSFSYTDINEAQAAYFAAVAKNYIQTNREKNIWARVTLETMEGDNIENRFIPGVMYARNNEGA